MIPYQRLDQAVPMEIPLESEEEGKAPTVSEARAKFDQVEGVPPKKVSRMEIQPVGPAAAPLAPKVLAKPKAPVPTPVPETMPRKVVPPVKKPAQPKSPSPRLLIILLHDLHGVKPIAVRMAKTMCRVLAIFTAIVLKEEAVHIDELNEKLFEVGKV